MFLFIVSYSSHQNKSAPHVFGTRKVCTLRTVLALKNSITPLTPFQMRVGWKKTRKTATILS